MTIVATKVILHISEERNCDTREIFAVDPTETVQGLLLRMGITGGTKWHFTEVAIEVKLCHPLVTP